ncbi:unnamed protein product [Paramecium pentaurelia]|uniref:Uncharacterized protein n=1 Tax=Paramecium pentaurelia TaxID=43138 RepID=A0A8S1XES2_9CILI|nr:unnamed protein product [Paramecium pentaurelia]
MKVIFIIFLSLLIVGCEKNLSTRIESLLQTQLGHTLLSTAQLALQTNTPLDRIIDTLQDLEDKYQKDQKEEDLENREFQQKCDTDLSNLNNEIDDIKRLKVKIQGAIDQLKTSIESKKKILDDKNALRKNLRKGMNEVDVIREYQVKVYEEKRGEVGKIIKTLEEVKLVYAQKLRTNFMELQTDKTKVQPEVFAEVTKQLVSFGKFKSIGKPFQNIIDFMIQMSKNGNNIGVLRNIIDLSESLIRQIDEIWQVERKAEEERVRWYTEYQKFMNTDFKIYDKEIGDLEAQIQSLKDRLAEYQKKMDDLNIRLESKEYTKEDRRNECQQAAYDYTQRRTSRADDRNIVSEVVGLLNVNMRDLKETLAQKMAAGDRI